MLEKAKNLAIEAHQSIRQKRKYSGEPYFIHPIAVAETVSKITDDQEVIAAAYLHDLAEDVFYVNPVYNFVLIENLFGERVKNLVIELTNVYSKESYPELDRQARKDFENARIASISDEAKLIKMADIQDNTKDLLEHDRRFAKIYLTEKFSQLQILTTNNLFYNRFRDNLEVALLEKLDILNK